MSRSRNYTIAAVLAGALSLANAIVAFILLPQGADKINHRSNQPPYAVILIEVVVGLIGVVAVTETATDNAGNTATAHRSHHYSLRGLAA